MVPAACLLEAVEAESELACRALDGLEQVMDGLVARGGHAHALAMRQEVSDQSARGPRLARSGRPLDHQMPAVEREHERLHLLEVGCLDRAGKRLAAQHRLKRRVAMVSLEERAPEPVE